MLLTRACADFFLVCVAQFGGLLAGIELGAKPISPWVRSNLHYLTTASGRTALLAFLGGLTWPLGRMGLVPALLTCFNAVFNANFAQLLAFVSEDDPASAGAGGPGLPSNSRRASGSGRASAAAKAAQQQAAWEEEVAEAEAARAGAEAALAAAQAAEAAAGGGDIGMEMPGDEDLLAMRDALEAERKAKGAAA